MRNPTLRHIVFPLAALVASAFAIVAQAQPTVTPQGSTVTAMFASQSEIYKASDPGAISFGPAGPGPYSPGAGIPNLPAAPTPAVTPPVGGNSFAGGGYTSNFDDNYSVNGYTQATSTIDDSVAGSPAYTSDINITLPSMSLIQGPTAPGYAYEQLNFGSNYVLTNNANGLLGSTPLLPLNISGTVTSGLGTYAEFDAVVDYTWIPATVNFAGVITQSGPSVSLGSLDYTFLQSGGGTFGTSLNNSGTLLPTPSGTGVLALDGHMWVAGDPAEFNVESAPEPPTLALLSVVILVLAGYVLRRRLAAKA